MPGPKMGNTYPNVISSYPSWVAHTTPYTAEWGNSVGFEFYKIEYELGVNVRKGYNSLAERLDTFQTLVTSLFAPCITLDENGTLKNTGKYGATVDTPEDQAYAHIHIPAEYGVCLKIRIHARSHVEDAEGMRLYSWGGGEDITSPRWNDCGWTVTKTSTNLGLTVNRHVYWDITPGDDGGIANIGGGRSIDFVMEHAAAAGDVAATNADIIGVEIFISLP